MDLHIARLPDGSPEIFRTLQGEGRSAGTPAVFLRLSLCNLYCVWCDTDYTWNWRGTPYPHRRDAEPGYAKYRREDLILDLPCEEVARRLAELPEELLVVTGGEPLLQTKGLTEMLTGLRERRPDLRVEVETNGTVAPPSALDALVDRYNVSPKLSGSGVPRKLRERPEALAAFAASGKSVFKLVVGGDEDLEEALALVAEHGIDRRSVDLMPEAGDPAELEARQAFVAAACMEHGLRYSDRLHLRLFGAKRAT